MASEAWSNANFHRAIDSVCEAFRVSSLYPEQEECLKAILQGKDVYASLPTGYGKSLIFYAVPIVSDQVFERPRGSSKIIIISPLKTLLGDLRQLGCFREHKAVHSLSTSFKNSCRTCFFKIGFLHTAPAICL